jgi:hypothetical protein
MVAFSSLVVFSVVSTAFSAPVPRALPTPVSVATAKTYLAALTVAVDSNVPAYSRDLFKTWDISTPSPHSLPSTQLAHPSNLTVSGTCDTRESAFLTSLWF